MRKAFQSVVFLILTCCSISYGQGVFLRGAGAINESMGGAATAAPIDALGALQWNPASISGLKQNEIAFSAGLVLPSTSLSTTHGSIDGQPGAALAPSMGLVWRQPCSKWTYGLGIQSVGGAKSAFPSLKRISGADVTLSQLDTLNSDILILQFAPTISYQLTENLSIGAAPTLTLCQILCDPLYITTGPAGSNPLDFPSGSSSRYCYGGGFQIGIYYDTKCNWQFGLCYKSTQWMEPFRYQTEEYDVGGNYMGENVRKLYVNLPQTISAGVAYSGFKDTLIALDLRYFGYAGAGDFTKLGWKDIFGFNLGIQRIVSERLTVRMGYSYNQNPINDEYTYRNLASSMITEHTIFLGGTIKITPQIDLSATYAHAFSNSISGASPLGTELTESLSADSLNMGVRVTF